MTQRLHVSGILATDYLLKAAKAHAAERVAKAVEGEFAGQGGEIRAVVEMSDEWRRMYDERMARMWGDVADAILEHHGQ